MQQRGDERQERRVAKSGKYQLIGEALFKKIHTENGGENEERSWGVC